MKAVSCLQGALSVVDVPTPQPGTGQLLLDVRRCGICGTDLHARVHADDLDGLMKEVGYDGSIRSDTPTVLGHEFCGEVLERGNRVGKEFTPGTHRPVTACAGRVRRADAGRGVAELPGAQRP